MIENLITNLKTVKIAPLNLVFIRRSNIPKLNKIMLPFEVLGLSG